MPLSGPFTFNIFALARIVRKMRSQNKIRLVIIIFVLSIGAVLLSCNSSKPTAPAIVLPDFNRQAYDIQNLDFSQRWFHDRVPPGFVLNFPHDQHGVIMSEWNGEYFYNPFVVINQGINYWVGLEQTSDPRYLELINNYTARLMIEGHRINGALYFPYLFDYHYAGNSNMVMVSPWYSGFAQGLALSFFSRVYETTGNEYFKSIADSVFYSFVASDTTLAAWVTMIDSLGYFWIEEYPFCPQIHVFNGFMTGIFGLHDYYMATGSIECSELLRGGCTTISHYFDQYRVPGSICYYSLRVHEQYASYHSLVILELRQIAKISGDSSFSVMADSLQADIDP